MAGRLARAMSRRGLVIGRFMPPHAGHDFLFRTALGLCDALTIALCAADDDPIAGNLRAGWLGAMAPAALIAVLRQPPPFPAHDDAAQWRAWRDLALHACGGEIALVFASDPYVFPLANALGARPVLVDPAREAYPVSAEAIRRDAAAQWRFVPRIVRPFYQKRLTLLGPESVGKTRLAADLAAHFSTLVMPEYGRAYDSYYKSGKGWRPEDFVALALTHAAMRGAIAGDAGPLLIEDTDAVQTAVWSQHLVGAVAPALEEQERRDVADHYLVLSPDVAWRQDGVRYAGDAATRAYFFDEALRRLGRLGAPHDIIAGDDFNARRAAALAAAARAFGHLPCAGA